MEKKNIYICLCQELQKTYTYVCLYVCLHVGMYICMYVCTDGHTYVCMHVCICMYACMCLHVYFQICLCVWIDRLTDGVLIIHSSIIDDSFCNPTRLKFVKALFGRRLNKWTGLHRCSCNHWHTWKAQGKTLRAGSWTVMDNMEIWQPVIGDLLVTPLKQATTMWSLCNFILHQIIIHHNLGR